MKNKTIGVFDSGLGGFAVFNALRNHFKGYSFTLFSDQINAPYGTRSADEIYDISYQAMLDFKERNISDVLVACNTVSATALKRLHLAFPEMNIWGIIDITVSQFSSFQGKVNVLATAATINSGVYESLLAEQGLAYAGFPSVNLVPLIEKQASGFEIGMQVSKDLRGVDNSLPLILACTHYPIIVDVISSMYEGKIFDSILPIYEFMKDHLNTDYLGVSSIYTSGDPKVMEGQIQSIFGVNDQVTSWK